MSSDYLDLIFALPIAKRFVCKCPLWFNLLSAVVLIGIVACLLIYDAFPNLPINHNPVKASGQNNGISRRCQNTVRAMASATADYLQDSRFSRQSPTELRSTLWSQNLIATAV